MIGLMPHMDLCMKTRSADVYGCQACQKLFFTMKAVEDETVYRRSPLIAGPYSAMIFDASQDEDRHHRVSPCLQQLPIFAGCRKVPWLLGRWKTPLVRSTRGSEPLLGRLWNTVLQSCFRTRSS